ncbi:MAG: hypothetical protein HUN04_21655 [Desulfobacter sp.]|nr:MAG: hypothetical protein HUN04_21655 [Desulfobacter sp.]
MAYSIELYFDTGFERKILKLWELLSESGLPSIMQKIGSRPHVAISILDSINKADIPGILRFLEKRHHPFEILFPAISLIPGGHGAVVLSPSPNGRLIDIQNDLYDHLIERGYSPRAFYQPDNWLPHCTVSKEMALDESIETIRICAQAFVPGPATVAAAGIIEFRPRKELGTCRLGEYRS